MKFALLVFLLLGWSAVLHAQSGISVEMRPTQVKPGELFELRVTMAREDFGRFELRIPGHEHLHRVAVEEVPVRLEGGRYRQQEAWLLQADSSGEFVIDQALAILETKVGIEEVKLDPIRIEVLAYEGTDESSEPLELPKKDGVNSEGGMVGWIVGGVLMALGCWFWMLKSNRTGMVDRVAVKSEADDMLERLGRGDVGRKDLERLMVGRDWSEESKAALAEVVYGGGSDLEGLLAMLRKEVGE